MSSIVKGIVKLNRLNCPSFFTLLMEESEIEV